MSQNYARLLNDQDLVEHFLSKVLDFDYSKLESIIYDIIAGEQGLVDLDIHSQTLNTTKFRDRRFKDHQKRWDLREQIIEELLTYKRPEDDDDLKLGNNTGAMPRSEIKAEKQAYILIGLPASGKSGISNKVADEYGAVILDSDFAKRKLPEFANYASGATVVHEESSQIVFGFSENPRSISSVFEIALSNQYNLVVPKIGQSPKGIISLAETLKKVGYDVHLTLISLLKRDATIRAIHRFHETKRYVPLGLIFDGYGNDPCLTYHVIKNKLPALFASFGAISTSVPRGKEPFSIDLTGDNPASLFTFKENTLI